MSDDNEQGPQEPPVAGDETDTLLGSLARQRAIFAWKSGGLDAAGLRARLGPSSMSLGGLLKHLALVEDEYFTVRLRGRAAAAAVGRGGLGRRPGLGVELGRRRLPRAAVRPVARVGGTLASRDQRGAGAGGLDGLAHYTTRSGESPSLRRILIDIIEEYARHVGHADLIRESVDGLTGEDPPR